MLNRTFLHIPSVGEKTERELWSQGVHTWEQFLSRKDQVSIGRSSRAVVTEHIEKSQEALEQGDAAFFAHRLPSNQVWRLYPDFAHKLTFLDIETTGSSFPSAHITTIGIYDGHAPRAFVRGRDLDAFAKAVTSDRVLVTYNGKCFDVPWIEAELGIRMPRAHIDLRYVLASLGLKGGLKSVERQVGFGREGALAEVDGYFAVLLWKHFERTRNPRVLETLLRYNLEDVVKLKPLIQIAYNRNLRLTPFRDLSDCVVEPTCEVEVPVHADVIAEVRRRYGSSMHGY